MIKKTILVVIIFFMTTNLFAAQTQIAQVNGMMCLKCQKMVTEALQEAMPNAKVKVSWPEGVAVSNFDDKSPITEEEYKNTMLGTGFTVVKVITVDNLKKIPGLSTAGPCELVIPSNPVAIPKACTAAKNTVPYLVY